MYRFIVSLVVLPLLVAAAGLDARTLTLDDIARLSSVGAVRMSPDGAHLAWTKTVRRTPFDDEDGAPWSELWMMEMGGEPRPLITGEVSVGGISWSHDGRHIHYLARRGDDKFRRLYALPVDGGESRPLVSHDNNISSYSISDDGRWLAFVARPKVPAHRKKLRDKGFKARIYEEELIPAALWTLDLRDDDAEPRQVKVGGHLTAAYFRPGDDQLLIRTSPTPLIDDILMLQRLSLIERNGRLVRDFEHKGKMEGAAWADDGSRFAFLGANDYNDPTAGALHIANAANGRVQRVSDNADSHIMAFDWDGTDLYYIEHKDAESRIMRRTSDGGTTEVAGYGNGIHTSVSAADGALAARTDSASHPPELYAMQGGQMRRQTNSNPWLDDIDLGAQEVITYAAEDGEQIQAVVVYPVGYRRGRKYPMIAFIHGGPEAHRSNGWNTRYADPIQAAAGAGYVSLIPNYRGSTGRGDRFARLDQHGYADPEFTDILDGKRHLVERGVVDGDRAGITGGSYGGYATAWSATALSEHWAAAVMFVGISDQISKFGTTDIPNEMHAVHSRAWPWDDFAWMWERSPLAHVQKHRTPILIMHGEDDPRVHPSQSLQMYRYLKVLDQAPVRLVWYPGEGHGNRKAAAQLDYSMRLMRWMNHYLKGRGGKPPPHDLGHKDRLDKETD